MECNLFTLLVQRYRDGELDAVARAEYEQHRRACASCRAVDARYAAVVGSLGAMSIYEPSPEFNRLVLARVDISVYRKSPARRFLGAVERSWNAVPIPARRGAVIAVLAALVIGVYKPLFDLVARAAGQGIGGLWEGVRFAHELVVKAAGMWRASGAIRNYEVVGETLLRALHRPASGPHPAHIIALAAIMTAAAVVLARRFRTARRNGETNVCLL